MATKTQPATSSARLSIFGFGSLSRAATSSHAHETEPRDSIEQEDDWYIPYNGPVEQQSRHEAPRDRDSWGDILSGWLTERGGGGGSSYNAREDNDRRFQATRARAVSNASQFTTSSAHRMSPARAGLQHRPSVPSFIDLDKAGGVGASPMPTFQTSARSVSPPPGKRSSLASILSFGRKSLHHSSSMDQLTRERGSLRRRVNTTASTSSAAQARQRVNDLPAAHSLHQEPIAEDNEFYYSSLLVHSSTRGVPNRQSPFSTHSTSPEHSPHPYAAVRPIEPEPPRSAPPVPVKGKTRFLDPNRLNLTLLDPRGPKIPAYLKPSPRNSLLKASVSTPNLRDIPRGKQRWLSAETWCDALILPRPRFAMRLVDGGPSGRIVSPPESPVSPSEAKFPLTGSRSGSSGSAGQSVKEVKKTRSVGNLFGAATAAAAVSSSVKEKAKTPVVSVAPVAQSQLKPNRPKSWALDDLALPSPVPSLAQVVAEGERLNAERKEWQSQATQSFQNKRIRSVRARSKSMNDPQTRKRTLSVSAQANAFDFLAERTLLGNQARPPTIHVHGPPTAKSHQHTASTGAGQTRSSVFSHPTSNAQTASRSRSRSHGHSNSVGHTVSYRSMTTDSTIHGHVRSQSLSKSALKMVRSTAVGAAALCGINGADRSPSMPGDERMNAFEGALRSNTTSMFKVGEHGNVLVFAPTSPTAALAMVSPQPGTNGFNGSSPTPSGMSVSAEGVGLAISSPEDQPRKYENPIVIQSHPYATGSSYYAQPPKLNIPEYTAPDSSSPSPQSATDSVNQRRQPVTHPYASLTHPYAAAKGQRPTPQHLDISPASPSIYAELSPGHISEFDPDNISYSPFVASPEEGPLAPAHTSPKSAPVATGHPYGPSASRYSELGFGEALTHTLRTQSSMDSGLGTSEAGGHVLAQVQGREPQYTAPPVILHSPETDELSKPTPGTYYEQGSPVNVYQRSADASSQALASSPLENTPPFRRRGSSGTRLSTGTHQGRSSGSSPGLVSQASSPPLSPRPLPVPGDLDRFKDLFYRPVDRASNPLDSPLMAPGLPSRQNSLPLDVSSQTSRSLSGLTNLARQLSEDLEELRVVEREASGELDFQSSPMWGRRFGGLRGERPDEMDDPNVVLGHSQVSSGSSSPVGSTILPLRLPSDTPFTNPASNFPEDIRMDETESSRASSVLEGSNFLDDTTSYLRVGEVEVTSTPPILTSPHRESTRLSVVEDEAEPSHDVDGLGPLRVPSQYSSAPSRYSSLASPLSPSAVRASYMTSDTDPSRMSGLSDFPVPPNEIVPFGQSSSSSASYFTGEAEDFTSSDTHPPPPPRPQGQTLLREPSKDTFGNQHDHDNHIGEAF